MERRLREKLTDGTFKDVTPLRSRVMGSIKGRGNKSTEVRLRSALVRAKIRGWKVHPRGIPGNPDFFFPDAKIAVFVDGCFWHGCPSCGHIPKVNNAFWEAKIEGNKQRDINKTNQLKENGITVLRFWEHELKSDIQSCIENIKSLL